MARPGKRAQTQLNIPMCLAGVLFCLTLFSFHFSGGVVARYSANAGGSDSARVIRFGELTLTEHHDEAQYIYPGAQLECDPKISFTGSESATYVFVEVSGIQGNTATGVKPLAISASVWKVADKWWPLVISNETSRVYCYNNGKPLSPNETLDRVSLFSDTTSEVDRNATAEQIKNAELTVKFRAHVVQSNGFDSAQAAWDSLSTNHP